MRTRCWKLVLIATLLLPFPALSQGRYGILIANLRECNAFQAGRVINVIDGISVSDCTVGGAEAPDRFANSCICSPDEGGWRSISNEELADSELYALLAGDADGQVIQGVVGAEMPRCSWDSNSVDCYGAGDTANREGFTLTTNSVLLWAGLNDLTNNFSTLELGATSGTLDAAGGLAQVSSTTPGGTWSAVQIDDSAATDVFTLRLSSVNVAFGNAAQVHFTVPLGIKAAATLPTCDTDIAPAGTVALMWDTTGPDLCVCDGSNWSAQDGTGTCE